MTLNVGFFANVVALDSDAHKNVKIGRDVNYAFSAAAHAIPAVVIEVPLLAKEYPVVIAKDASDSENAEDSYVLLTALGFAEKSNAYVSDEGDWLAEYVPAHIRRYPFISLPTTEDPDKSVLCIDKDAPHFAGKGGKALFNAKGEATEITEQALRMNEEYELSMAETRRFIADIAKENILQEHTENSDFGNVTFFRIDVEKFNELDADTIGKWKENNYLTVLSWMIQSQRNWREVELRLRFKQNTAEEVIQEGEG